MVRPASSHSLRRVLLTHELALLSLVALAGALGAVWAYFWQQTASESIRLNGLAYEAEQLRTDLFRQVKEVPLARLRDAPDAERLFLDYTKAIKSRFNSLRRGSASRAEDYAIQELQQAYSKIQSDLRSSFGDPYLMNRIIRSQWLDPNYEQALLAGFETAFRNLRGLISQLLQEQQEKRERWIALARVALPLPVVFAILLLLFSRASMQRRFVRPMQDAVAAIRRISQGDLSVQASRADEGVEEVAEINRGISHMAGELERSRDNLVERERQTALGALVPVIAHNIRNPLASIRATAQLITSEDSAADLREGRDAIIDAVDRLDRWVSALVSYLHPLKPTVRQLPAVSLVDATIKLLSQRIEERGIQLRRQPWEDTLLVEADPDLMEQAIFAVLTNAVDATPHAGTVTVAVQAHDATVVFTFIDEGGGIPFMPEPHGLEPGPTTKKMGTGLGIPLAFKVCKAHGWTLRYAVDEGVGTRVSISAPLAGTDTGVTDARATLE